MSAATPGRVLEVFALETVAAATGGFSAASSVGRGGYGNVHAGKLPDGREIAVKRLRLGDKKTPGSSQARAAALPRASYGANESYGFRARRRYRLTRARRVTRSL